jgi:hypothetical protein
MKWVPGSVGRKGQKKEKSEIQKSEFQSPMGQMTILSTTQWRRGLKSKFAFVHGSRSDQMSLGSVHFLRPGWNG